MKYIQLVADGMADLPLPELDGKTPMQAAVTPNFDALADRSLVGSVQTIPAGMRASGDLAWMNLLGYDPNQYYTGLGPLEASALRVPMDRNDVAFRCSLVSSDGTMLLDDTGGHITTKEGQTLIELIDKKLGGGRVKFFPGDGHRHVMGWRDGKVNMMTTPPRDFVGQALEGRWPTGDGESYLQQLMLDSLEILDDHPINQRRREEGKEPGNMIWLWGQGRPLSIPLFLQMHGKTGAVVTALNAMRGLARAAGMRAIDLPSATGQLDTDYLGKANSALSALDTIDFVFLHIHSPDEASREGNLDHKLRTIEDIDKKVVSTLRRGMEKRGDYRLLIVPSHATPIALKTQKEGPVPFLLYDSTRPHTQSHYPFDERAVEEAKTQVEDGTQLIEMLFGEK
ncbi:MAG: cofactor-independent phosphoglycerate mutase [Capsulimonas sp.]|uniref:cofactor-independent phosphoglycerate mutase n=1 Tax=Capsulimonas sp. TaxID=2494211 RepID=UPI0032647669